jgi:hypothetical protein
LRVSGNIVGQELQRNETTQLGVLSLVNDTHPPTAELFNDAVARNGLADHWRKSYEQERVKSKKAEEIATT